MALLEDDLGDDPMVEVQRWLDDAFAAGLVDPGAMQLATAGPTVRTVLLRGFDQGGFVFFTNLESRKGRQLAADPSCALTLVWTPMHRQICATGVAERVTDAEVEAYWRTRPRASRVGAWASPQSQVIGDRDTLDRLVAESEERFAGSDDIPVPPFWGGWRVVPDSVELWCGHTDRLHDRIRWRRDAPGSPWVRERLAP